MASDPRFFVQPPPRPLADLARAAGLDWQGAAPGPTIRGVAALRDAGPDEISVLHNPRYREELATTQAAAVLVRPQDAGLVPAHSIAVPAADPHAVWARLASLLFPAERPRPGIHPSAVIEPSAGIHPSAEIGACAVIGAGAEIGADCRIGAGAVIGPGVVLGRGCRIGACASLSHTLLGERVVIHPGARIGQDGFGFAITAHGMVSVPQLGRVLIGDAAEIGSNATVDRGASGDTVIGPGCRLDNLVQVGHNVRLGIGCVLVAQSGISGSTVLGNQVQIGAQAGLTGHLRLGEGVRIGAQAGVMSDVPAGAERVGSPALPVREFFRNVAVLRRLARKGPESGSMG